jgi:trans-aconitate methyltransferase
MAQNTLYFDDGEAYERFMGRWSRAAGSVFLDWLAPMEGARWLDVGCGTGAFTQLILDTRAPSAVVADQSRHSRRIVPITRSQIAARRPVARARIYGPLSQFSQIRL